MNIVNLTPHPISILVNEETGECRKINPSGIVARVGTVRAEIPAVAGVRVIAQDMGDIVGLPAEQPDTIYIVSAMVLAAFKDERGQGLHSRRDVFAPDTGPDAVRDHNGHIVAVRGLVC